MMIRVFIGASVPSIAPMIKINASEVPQISVNVTTIVWEANQYRLLRVIGYRLSRLFALPLNRAPAFYGNGRFFLRFRRL
jgi:hypothetical protein